MIDKVQELTNQGYSLDDVKKQLDDDETVKKSLNDLKKRLEQRLKAEQLDRDEVQNILRFMAEVCGTSAPTRGSVDEILRKLNGKE